jgi:hypothetical protein
MRNVSVNYSEWTKIIAEKYLFLTVSERIRVAYVKVVDQLICINTVIVRPKQFINDE